MFLESIWESSTSLCMALMFFATLHDQWFLLLPYDENFQHIYPNVESTLQPIEGMLENSWFF